MPAVVGTLAHAGVGVTLFAFGVSVVIRSKTRSMEWKNKSEYTFLTIVGIIQSLAPMPILIMPSICGNSNECIQRNLIHMFCGLALLIGVLYSKAMHKSHQFDFGIPLAGFITAYFLTIHDHDVGSMDPLAMTNDFLHVFASLCIMVASTLRAILDYYKSSVEIFFGVAISSAGMVFFLMAPDITEAIVSGIGITGHVIGFSSVLFTLCLHLILYKIIHDGSNVRADRTEYDEVQIA
ncbi:MAG: hypothetical protein Hyperionvirus42_4 [Hyperionvirus sp.]|uniref:Uncharacterized protein n=1 Tax=Hyperionvirus sp. TaxID=2487770 RepID=A0A3G5AC47_9VIRU|nr:MAG: hypothetical protein Hyperionvirus42_4 [Hyperionvirus sp.]